MSCRNSGFARPVVSVIAVMALLASVAGCGFTPLHSRLGGAGAARLAGIKVLPILDREGQILSNFLRDKLTPHGPPRQPIYLLSVKLIEFKQSLGVRTDESATRANLKIVADFDLRAASGNKAVLLGKAESTSSFNILSSSFATLAAEKDARLRSLRELSDEIKSRISIFLGRVQ
jgi:LPS-assembly lipoprotein